MATWRDIKAFVKSGYHVVYERPDMLQLELQTAPDRSQVVYLWHRRIDKREDWLVIGSPFAQVDEVDLPEVLEAAGRLIVGGIVGVGSYLAIRHAVPLANFDGNELERPLSLVTLAADQMEHELFDDDRY